jgi:hypothetical protein
MNNNLSMPMWSWRSLVLDLRRRGNGQRESGAFLLAPPGRYRVAAHVCYDDLDSTALDQGIIVFHGAGYVRLWDLCEKRQLRVVADIHTHPGRWTGQSPSDETHPMVGSPGHVALIAPHFARENALSLRGVGIYRYLGNHRWETCTARSGAFHLSLL